MTAYDRCAGLYNELNQLHFELLLLAYGAYLTFFQFCQTAFPDMGMQVMTQMVAGYDTTMFRPDDELKDLAGPHSTLAWTRRSSRGARPRRCWRTLPARDAGRSGSPISSAQAPVVLHVAGDGFYHHHRAWADDLRLPFTAITGYIALIREGTTSTGRRTGCSPSATDRDGVRGAARNAGGAESFDEMLGLCRHVFPHAEGHKFFIEHWGTSLFFNKMREIGAVMSENGFFASPDDIFYLNIHEVHEALSTSGSPGREARRRAARSTGRRG